VDDQILFCGAAPTDGFEIDPAKREWSQVKALDNVVNNPVMNAKNN
jgi:hypothetical protein